MGSLQKIAQLKDSAIVSYASTHPYVNKEEGNSGKIVQIPYSVSMENLITPIIIQYTPQNPVATNVLTGVSGYTDINVQNFPGVLKFCWLEIDVSETASQPITPTIAPYLINFIQIMGQSGNPELQRIYNDDIIENMSLLTFSQFQNMCNMMNMNTAFANPQGLNNSSAVYMIPIFGFFMYCDLLLSAMRGQYPLTFRINWQPTTALEVTTGTSSVTGITLHCLFDQLLESDRKDLYDRFNDPTKPYELPLLTTINQPINQTFTAGTQYNLLMSSAVGQMNSIYAIMRASKTGSGYRTWTNIINGTTIQILDGSGLPVICPVPLRYDITRFMVAPLLYTGELFTALPSINWNFDSNPINSILRGMRNGVELASGFHKFNLNLNASFPTGTFTLDLYYRIWQHFEIKEGQFILYGPNVNDTKQ
jgi:hypothetical protein